MAARRPPDRTRPMGPPPRAARPPMGAARPPQGPLQPPPPAPPGLAAGYIPWWVLLIITALFGLLFAASWAAVLAVRSGNPPRPSPTAVVVVIFPTSGPPPAEGTAGAPLPEQPTPTIPPAPAGPINLGNSVRVFGTGGDGLRLRVGPGLNETPNYLALENEVLVVHSGPTIADGFTWWFLVDPADDRRNGWAVENYLEVVSDG